MPLQPEHAELLHAAQQVASESALWRIPEYEDDVIEWDATIKANFREALGHLGIGDVSYDTTGQVGSITVHRDKYADFLGANAQEFYPVPEKYQASMNHQGSARATLCADGSLLVACSYQDLGYHPDARPSADYRGVNDFFRPDGTIERSEFYQRGEPLAPETISPFIFSALSQKLNVLLVAGQAIARGDEEFRLPDERRGELERWRERQRSKAYLAAHLAADPRTEAELADQFRDEDPDFCP